METHQRCSPLKPLRWCGEGLAIHELAGLIELFVPLLLDVQHALLVLAHLGLKPLVLHTKVRAHVLAETLVIEQPEPGEVLIDQAGAEGFHQAIIDRLHPAVTDLVLHRTNRRSDTRGLYTNRSKLWAENRDRAQRQVGLDDRVLSVHVEHKVATAVEVRRPDGARPLLLEARGLVAVNARKVQYQAPVAFREPVFPVGHEAVGAVDGVVAPGVLQHALAHDEALELVQHARGAGRLRASDAPRKRMHDTEGELVQAQKEHTAVVVVMDADLYSA